MLGSQNLDTMVAIYYKDRAYTFEDQLNQITNRMMDKPIQAYDSAELTCGDSNDDPFAHRLLTMEGNFISRHDRFHL